MKSRLFIASLGLATCLGGFATTANAQSLSDRLDGVARQQARSSASEQKAVMLGRLLYSDITVDFDETPARSAIEYFRTVLGVTIIGRFNDDRTGTGIDPDTPITISIRNQPALTALEFVLEQCAAEIDEPCIWQLRNGFIEVGTKERLGRKSARETRYYPIKDMLFNPPNFDNAPDFDLDSAFGQGGGNGNGGGGGGGGFGGGGSGGGGSGGGRGGGSGGGGSLFGGDVEEVERMSETERAEQIMDLIREIVEPDEWDLNGGESARMRYYQGVLIITAPDFVHRQVNGYPFRPAAGPSSQAIGQANPATSGRRFVTFGSEGSKVELPDGTRVGVGVDPEESMTMAERAKAQREQRQRDAAAREAARRESTPPPASGNRSGG